MPSLRTRTSLASLTRRGLLGGAAGGAAAVVGCRGLPAFAGAPAILKPLPEDRFVDYGTNAEMRWDSVTRQEYLTPQADLFVRNHTATPVIDPASYRLRVHGDGLASPRSAADPLSLSLQDLRALPTVRQLSVHECTGNGRSYFATQQGESVSGTPWRLGAVGTIVWEGVRLRDVLRRVGIADDAVSIQASGLDAPYVAGGVDYGRVRRPFPVAKAIDDALLAWAANGEPLLPDHGYPLRLVLPGWVGIASIKWLGSLEVSRSELTSPWNTKWYRLTGGDHPAGSPPLTVNPVRSAWELPVGALPVGRPAVLTGRAWSGAAPIRSVDVSLDGGATWRAARVTAADQHVGHGAVRGHGWARFSVRWERPDAGAHELLARATDAQGRTQPFSTPYNDNGYFFDAVVRHPVTVGG